MADTFLVIGTGPTVNIVLSGAGTPYTAGTGITISGANVITNTAPDQTVTMTDGTGIDVTGTYPNFTVTNTAPNVVQTLSIAGQDLTLSNGGGTVEIPAGSSLGTGFTAGGGGGSVPESTIMAIQNSDAQIIFGDTDWASGTFSFKPFSSSDEKILFSGEELLLSIVDNSGNQGQFRSTGFSVQNTVSSNIFVTVGSIGLSVLNGAGFSSDLSGSANFIVTDSRATKKGIEYAADYSATIAANNRSITDTGTVNLLKQAPVSYTNAAAPNNCIFYSTTVSKLCYKDPGGTVNPLY